MNRLSINTALLLLITSLPALASMEASLDTSYLNYQEYTWSRPDFMHSSTRMLGVHAQGDKALNRHWRINPDVKVAYGDETYYGGFTNTKTGVHTPLTQHHIPNLYANIKASLAYHAWSHFTPHIGIGYRFFQTDDSNFSPGGGYLRRSHYFYLPVGFSYKISAIPHWKLSLNMDQNIFLEGKQYSDDRSYSARSYVENAQYYGYGSSISMTIKKDSWPISLQPYFNIWRIEDSEVYAYIDGQEELRGITEPNNTSKEYGLRIAWTVI
jgi:hypothetical protein